MMGNLHVEFEPSEHRLSGEQSWERYSYSAWGLLSLVFVYMFQLQHVCTWLHTVHANQVKRFFFLIIFMS